MKKVELLAPAGNLECLKVAVDSGADAIYIGGNRFSNRAYATNFNDEEIIEGFNYAHLKNVKIYVGINIAIYENEIQDVFDYVDFLYVNGVDALIVSDLGMIDALKSRYHDLPIHVSTQANIHSLWQIKQLEKMNVERVILARETPISTIKYIKENSNVDLEVFCFGALCVCYSGNCLHSSFIGKRSGNRGMCAQPCRMKYTLLCDNKKVSDEAYLLSLKDLNILDSIDKVIESGVDSLKIEGRMKNKEYVALVVKTFRESIDYYYENKAIKDTTKEIQDISKIFSRGFTKGYLLNAKNNEMGATNYPSHLGTYLGRVIETKDGKVKIKLATKLNQQDRITILNEHLDEIKMYVSKLYVNNKLVACGYKGEIVTLEINSKIEKNVAVYKTIDSKFIENIDNNIKNNVKKMEINMSFTCHVGNKIKLIVTDILNNKVELLSENIIEKAINNPTTRERIYENLAKLGNTPFVLNDISLDIDDDIIIPISIINSLRRQAVENLSEKILNSYKRTLIIDKYDEYISFKEQNKVRINVKVINKSQLDVVANIEGINTIYYDNIDDLKTVKRLYPKLNIVPVNARIDNYNILDSKIIKTSNIGDLTKYKDNIIHTDSYLNVLNHYSVEYLLKNNVSKIGLSPELSEFQIKDLISYFTDKYGKIPPFEILAYGKIETMITNYCPISNAYGKIDKHCNCCRGKQFALKDRMGYRFPLRTDNKCTVTIYNSIPISLFENLNKIVDMGISNILLSFVDEDNKTIKEIINAFILKLNNEDVSLNIPSKTGGYF